MATKEIFRAESSYQPIYVGEQKNVRFLRFGGEAAGWQGALIVDRPERLYFPYQQAFSLYSAWLPDVRSFLSIGVGTGTSINHVQRVHQDVKITGIEWDPVVIETARRYFGVSQDAIRLIEADARIVLPTMRETFDMIFLDAYFRERTPKTFFSPVYQQVLADHLRIGGLLVINVIARTMGLAAEPYRSLCAQLNALVGPVFILDLAPVPFTPHNVVLFCLKRPIQVPELRVIRKRARDTIRTHASFYAPWARILPFLISRG